MGKYYSEFLLRTCTILLFKFFTIISTEVSKDIPEEIGNANDGEKFIKDIINSKKPTDRPEQLIFTAPFIICNGKCRSNVSNFIMKFPIYVGLKKSQKFYPHLYPRDHKSIFSSRANAPFRKISTRVPYTLCPDPNPISNEPSKEPLMVIGCPVKFIFTLLPTTYVKATLPWERWTWKLPQEPIEHFFRRYDNKIMPIKTPQMRCECPPNKECRMEYEINEDIIYFQNLKGIIKDKELMQLKKDFNKVGYRKNNHLRKTFNGTITSTLSRKRRVSDIIMGSKEITRDCCCPTKIVKIPAFITNKKFDEFIERLNEKGVLNVPN